jgi:hypothetical protein
VSVEQFLDLPIGFVPVAHSHGQPPSAPITPRQVIKWTANKMGSAHYDPNKPAALQSLRSITGYT